MWIVTIYVVVSDELLLLVELLYPYNCDIDRAHTVLKVREKVSKYRQVREVEKLFLTILMVSESLVRILNVFCNDFHKLLFLQANLCRSPKFKSYTLLHVFPALLTICIIPSTNTIHACSSMF